MSEKNRKRLASLFDLIHQIQGGNRTRIGSEDSAGRDSKGHASPFLVAGLGNPGRKYARNRHNIGFMVIDRLAIRLGVRFSRMQNKALVTDGLHAGHKMILVKPQTYMNDSGQAVAPLIRFYKVPLDHLIVIFDDMDLPLGTVRIRPKGGSGGQKGMKSIIQQLGNQQDFPRLRMGLGRPPGQLPPPAFLLQDFSEAELELVSPMLDAGVEAVLTIVTEGLDRAMNQFNGLVK